MSHRLIGNYLQDLDRALLDADPRERADTVAAIREHIDQALTDSSSSTDVNQVLQDLGSVEMIAAGVTPAHSQEAPSDARLSRAASILLALGIISFLTSPIFFISLPFAIVTIVWSIIALKRRAKFSFSTTTRGRGRLWAALILSSLAVIISLLALIGLLSWNQSATTTTSLETVVGAGLQIWAVTVA